MWRWVDLRAAVVFVCMPALFGCAVVDSYSGRAVDYNREAEQATEQALLLNVIRASLRRPMQFTGLQSITGSANVSGSVAGGGVGTRQTPYISLFPLGSGGPAALAQSTNSAIASLSTGNASASGALSGSATFTVPVLDTQEFYQGILTPISLQGFDLYLQQGYPPELLFDLVVAKIEVIRLDDGTCRKFTFLNSVRDDLAFGQFQAFADYLIGSGFSSEHVNSVTAYGPPIPPPRDGANAAETAALLEAYSRASSAGLDIKRVQNGANTLYHVQKKKSDFRFCFAHPGGLPPDWIASADSAVFCGGYNRRANRPGAAETGEHTECVADPRVLRSKLAVRREESEADFDRGEQGFHNAGVSEFHGIRLAPQFLERIREVQGREVDDQTAREDVFRTEQFENGLVSFKIYTRSTEGIIYYLGEVIRRRLFPEFGGSRTIQFKNGLRFGTIPRSECDPGNTRSTPVPNDLVYLGRSRSQRPVVGARYSCENLFVVESDSPLGDSVLSVSYDGRYFAIPRDPQVAGRTTQVLELVKQLLALNTSAKQLPATSVISVVGAP